MLICILIWNLPCGCYNAVWLYLGQVGNQSGHPSSFFEGIGVHHYSGHLVKFEKSRWTQFPLARSTLCIFGGPHMAGSVS